MRMRWRSGISRPGLAVRYTRRLGNAVVMSPESRGKLKNPLAISPPKRFNRQGPCYRKHWSQWVQNSTMGCFLDLLFRQAGLCRSEAADCSVADSPLFGRAYNRRKLQPDLAHCPTRQCATPADARVAGPGSARHQKGKRRLTGTGFGSPPIPLKGALCRQVT